LNVDSPNSQNGTWHLCFCDTFVFAFVFADTFVFAPLFSLTPLFSWPTMQQIDDRLKVSLGLS